jgi:hypothetical protein
MTAVEMRVEGGNHPSSKDATSALLESPTVIIQGSSTTAADPAGLLHDRAV